MTREHWLMTGAVVLAAAMLVRAWWLRSVEDARSGGPLRRRWSVGVLWFLAVSGLVAGFRYAVGTSSEYHTSRWLFALASVAIAWIGLQARSWMRHAPADADGAPVPLSVWLPERLAAEWPLLALFLLAPTIALPEWPILHLERPDLVLLAPAALAAWWFLDWRSNRHGHPLRNPLSLLADALRQLWRYKLLLTVLILCWLVSAGLYWLAMATWYPEWHQRGQQALAMDSLSLRDAIMAISVEMDAPDRNLPQSTKPPVGDYTAYALYLLIAVWFIWLMLRRPAWLPTPVRERLRWPAHLLVAAALVSAMYVTVVPRQQGGSWVLWAVYMATSFLAIPASALLSALLWWILLRIARRRPWGMRQATRVVAYCWGSVSALLFVSAAAAAVVWVGLPTWEAQRAGRLVDVTYDLMMIAFALVPWLIVDRRMRLCPALGESWRLATTRSRDVLVFATRYWLMMTLAAATIATFTSASVIGGVLVKPLLRSFVQLMGVLTMAAAYRELQGRPSGANPRPRPE